MEKIYAVKNPMWYADTFIFSYMEDFGCYVYVKVKTGVSDDNYTQVTSGLSESDTIAYDPSSVSSDSYYDYGGYDYSDGEVIGDAENAADLAEGGEEMLPEETENSEEPAADGIDPAETGAVVVN